MRISIAAMALAVTSGASLPAPAGVTVKFVEPDKYTDIKPHLEQGPTLAVIEAHLKKLGAKYMGASQDLAVEVLDIDLAGEMRMIRMGEVRVVKGAADWPRIKLRFKLEEGGKVLGQGDANLSDMNYRFSVLATERNEPLAYEKHLLEDWFRKTLAAAAKP